MTFSLESRVIEHVPAWVNCERCGGTGQWAHPVDLAPCPSCQGEGGRWHEAVYHPKHCVTNEITGHYLNYNCSSETRVTKSSILVREYGVCGECGGKKRISTYDNTASLGESVTMQPCDHCLKDADGNPTGAEPNTAGEWRVA